MEIETIYHGDCHCLMCDDITSKHCLKRFFTCHDLEGNRLVRIAICNDYIRLLSHNRYANKEYSYRNYAWFVKDIASEIIENQLGYKKEYIETHGNDFLEAGFNFIVCDKASTYRPITFVTAINLSLNGCYSINHALKTNLDSFFARISKYKKYKNQVETFNKLTKKLKWSHFSEREVLLTTITTSIFEQTIKNKQLCNQ